MATQLSLNEIGFPAFVLVPDAVEGVVYAECNLAWYEGADMAADQVIGKSVRQIFPGRYGEQCYQRHLDTLNRRAPAVYKVFLPLKTVNQRLHTRLTPVLDADGQLERIIGVSTNSTLEHVADETQAMLGTISSELEDFIALAAHDLQTPMRHVSSLADMLRQDFTDLGDGKLDLINMLESVSLQATSLITEVLEHARAVSATEKQCTFDFKMLCDDLLVILDPEVRHDCEISQSAVMTDKVATQIGLQCLLDNAIRHGGRDRTVLTVQVEQSGDEMLCFSVRDNGGGFADPATAFGDDGKIRADNGYGLLGVRRLINTRGGQIHAENCSGGGSLVQFTLPGHLLPTPDPAPGRAVIDPKEIDILPEISALHCGTAPVATGHAQDQQSADSTY